MASEQHARSRRWRSLTGWSIIMGGVGLLLATKRRQSGRDRAARNDGDAQPDALGSARAGGRGRPQTPPSSDALKDGYETHDANPRSIGLIMAVAVSVIAVAIAGLFVLLGRFHARDAAGPPLTAQQRALIAPPGPPLQSSPQYDLASQQAVEDQKLRGYRWLDATHSRAQIPIDRAMALVVGKSLDATP